jgi:uncharacterized protein YecE (DUF72 family)
MTTEMRKVLTGIGGWEHGTLDGLLYGAGETETQEKLAQYARFFDAVEVRATFWDDALGAPEAASWLRAVRENKRFVFGVKLHRAFTHGRIYTAESARTIRGLLQELARADRLAALVMQFPASFTNTGTHRHHLTKLAGLFAGFPLAAEFRHTSWHHPSMVALLEELGVTAVQADLPRLAHLMPFHTALVGRTAYLRLHGRNERGWLQNGMDTRYDYLYNGREVREIERRLEHLEGKCDRAVVIWNNTTGGKATANAFQLQAALHGVQVPVPERTLAAFPHLRAIGVPAEEREPLFAAEAYRRVS